VPRPFHRQYDSLKSNIPKFFIMHFFASLLLLPFSCGRIFSLAFCSQVPSICVVPL
jgi:hypothetical protein